MTGYARCLAAQFISLGFLVLFTYHRPYRKSIDNVFQTACLVAPCLSMGWALAGGWEFHEQQDDAPQSDEMTRDAYAMIFLHVLVLAPPVLMSITTIVAAFVMYKRRVRNADIVHEAKLAVENTKLKKQNKRKEQRRRRNKKKKRRSKEARAVDSYVGFEDIDDVISAERKAYEAAQNADMQSALAALQRKLRKKQQAARARAKSAKKAKKETVVVDTESTSSWSSWSSSSEDSFDKADLDKDGILIDADGDGIYGDEVAGLSGTDSDGPPEQAEQVAEQAARPRPTAGPVASRHGGPLDEMKGPVENTDGQKPRKTMRTQLKTSGGGGTSKKKKKLQPPKRKGSTKRLHDMLMKQAQAEGKTGHSIRKSRGKSQNSKKKKRSKKSSKTRPRKSGKKKERRLPSASSAGTFRSMASARQLHTTFAIATKAKLWSSRARHSLSEGQQGGKIGAEEET